MFTGVSTNGTSAMQIQIGDSGGVEVSGYTSSASTGGADALSSTGFMSVPASVAAATVDGAINLFLANSGSYKWVASGVLGSSDSGTKMSGGSKSLSAELDRVRITTVNGTDAFDAGEINIQYEI